MEYIIVVIACGAWGQWLGRRKGYPWAGMWLGGLLGLIGIAIIVWGLKDKRVPAAIVSPATSAASLDPDEAALAKEVRLAKLRNEQHKLDKEFYSDDPAPTESPLAMPPVGFRPDTN